MTKLFYVASILALAFAISLRSLNAERHQEKA